MFAEGNRKVAPSYCHLQQNKEQSSAESNSISCLPLRCFCTLSCCFNSCNNRIQIVYKESNPVVLHDSHDCISLFSSKLHGTVIKQLYVLSLKKKNHDKCHLWMRNPLSRQACFYLLGIKEQSMPAPIYSKWSTSSSVSNSHVRMSRPKYLVFSYL